MNDHIARTEIIDTILNHQVFRLLWSCIRLSFHSIFILLLAILSHPKGKIVTQNKYKVTKLTKNAENYTNCINISAFFFVYGLCYFVFILCHDFDLGWMVATSILLNKQYCRKSGI